MKQSLWHRLATVAVIASSLVLNWKEAKAEHVDSLTYYKLDDLVVMGVKAQTKLQAQPISSTSIDLNTLNNRGVTNIKDFTGMVPNFIMIDRDTPHTSSVLVRGVGSKLRPAVVMYVDGVPHFEKSTFDFALNDVEKIEFLRGPQGTTFGRNAMGGIILVQTRSPFKHQGTTIRINGSSLGEATASIAHLNRLSEHWALSISGNYRFFRGYIPNTYDGSMSDRAHQGALSAKLEWSPNANTMVRFTNSFDLTRQGAFTYGAVDTKTMTVAPADLDHKSQYDRKLYDGGLLVTHHADKYLLRGQISAHLVDARYDVDQDGTSVNAAYVLQTERQKLFSQELTLEGKNKEAYNWRVGAFAFQQKIDRTADVTMVLPRAVEIHRLNDELTWGASLYHQSTLTLWQRLRLEAGARLDYEHARLGYFERKGQKETKDNHAMPFFHITPKVSVQYFFTPDIQLYATVSQGYTTGGFNTVYVGEENRSYGAERSWNYEVGTKGWLLPHRLYGEVVLFAIDTKDKQLNKTIPGLGQATYNAGSTLSKGVEAALEAHITDRWQASAAYGYTHAVFTDTDQFRGHFLPFVPRHTLAANTEYTLPLRSVLSEKLTLHLGYKGIGDMYWHEDNAAKQAFYHLLDASIAVKKRGLRWTIYGNNLLNSSYLGYFYTVEPKKMGKPGRPRTIGVSITYDF
ncbi:Vitamin B12 transporter BtuB [Porphyromonas levii]|uniref:TonB-dependent receptor n=1 Tax=Porphyromonas levii TaxID=28114 RepID=UPI001B8A9AC1|nr:Vitamin B12 transporter BtuB [Porphyromonas levii]